MKSEYNECPKCGFTASPVAKNFNFEWKDRCYGSQCSWVDKDITEHMHIICPDCGYMVGVQGCIDYKALKEKKNTTLKPWTDIHNNTGSTTSTSRLHSNPTSGRRYVAGQGYVDGDGWDTTECPSCPMTEKNPANTTP